MDNSSSPNMDIIRVSEVEAVKNILRSIRYSFSYLVKISNHKKKILHPI
jgi:hypothetical protein